ncbi:hypothetical protein NDU88_006636 [Pleurodeles waltl]|uniref:Uncharacterized protein n=1 Tax=Pleurodeles waltl TaxID=8319 RepID=A0AAV7L4M8_PLEWA|nr:hypothetical protein NDU88_006636 [Pleurodeles waltl]
MEPSGLSAVRRGHIQRPQYGQTLVQNGALWAVSHQARAPTETPLRTDTCTEWRFQPSGEGTHRDPCTGCQPSGEGTHRDPSTDRHLYRMESSELSAVRRGHPQRPRYGLSGEGTHRDPSMDRHLYRMEPSGLSAVRRGLPRRPRYGQTLVQNGAVRAVSRQAMATETPVRTDTCTEWSPLDCQPSGEGTHRDSGTDRHLYRMEPSGLSAARRGHPQRPRYGQTLVQNGAIRAVSCQVRAPTETPVWAVSRQARAPTETPVRTYTCTEWSPLGCQARAHTETPVRTDTCTECSPLGCQPSGEGNHRDRSTDRHLYRMELSAVRRGHPQRPLYGLSALRRGHPQRPQYGQTLVQNGALWAVSRQARVPTETSVRTDTCTEWSPPGCQLSGEGTHRDPGMGCQPSGEGTHRDPLVWTDTCTEWSPPGCQPSGEGTHGDPGTGRRLYRMEPSGLSAVRRWPQRPRYEQTLEQNGALRTVSRQARAPTETPVRTDTCTEWSPPGCQPSGEGTHRDPGMRPRYGQTLVQNGALSAVSRQARAPTETPVQTDTCKEWNPPGCQPPGEGTHRDPGTDRHLYRMEPSGLSAIRRGYPQRPRYGQTLVQNGALRAVSPQARAPTETPVRTDTCTEWCPLGCQPSGEGTYRDPSTDRHLYRMEPSGLSGEGYRDPGTDRHLYRM